MHRRTDQTVEIDVGGVSTPEELQELLYRTFHFPAYYGNNWNAFDECIRDVEVPNLIRVTQFERLRSRLPTEAQSLSDCLRDFVRDEPGITVEIS